MPQELGTFAENPRPRVVLDPALCLHPIGFTLVQRLQRQSELWLVRELWNILDNSHYFCTHPAALRQSLGSIHDARPVGVLRASNALASAEPDPTMRSVLRNWEQLRLSTDLAGLKLYWLGDGLAESLLPDGVPTRIHVIFDRLVESLDHLYRPDTVLACAQRDALALALALGGATILGTIDGDGASPSLCQDVKESDIVCLEVNDRFATWQKEQWLKLLGHTQCFPLLWSGLRLALIHVELPGRDVGFEMTEEAFDACEDPQPVERMQLCSRDLRLFFHAL
jgi:hypothetical protein